MISHLEKDLNDLFAVSEELKHKNLQTKSKTIEEVQDMLDRLAKSNVVSAGMHSRTVASEAAGAKLSN